MCVGKENCDIYTSMRRHIARIVCIVRTVRTVRTALCLDTMMLLLMTMMMVRVRVCNQRSFFFFFFFFYLVSRQISDYTCPFVLDTLSESIHTE